MSTQIFVASTLYGALTLSAAIDAGQFGPAGSARRILVVCTNTEIPEVTTPLDAMQGFESLRPRFDAVISWNEVIFPYHPSLWDPRTQDVSMWRELLGLRWNIPDGPMELVVESIQVKPALTFCKIFRNAWITVYADGLMTYGPTRNELARDVHSRIRRTLYLELIPGLRPLLLTEYGVPSEPVRTDAVQRVFAEFGQSCVPALRAALPAGFPAGRNGVAMLLGQYLSSIGLLTEEEEERLHLRMFEAAVGLGFTSVLFKPHPSAPQSFSDSLVVRAQELNVQLVVLETPLLAEAVFGHVRPRAVIGCFSTGLFTARAVYGIPAAAVGAREVLRKLRPYPNSNRIPVTICEVALPDLEGAGFSAPDLLANPDWVRGELAEYVAAVGYCMQPERNPHLRDRAVAYVTRALPQMEARPALRMHFKPDLLYKLSLPGAPSDAEMRALEQAEKERKGKRGKAGTKGRPALEEITVDSFREHLQAGDLDAARRIGEQILKDRKPMDVLIGMARVHIGDGDLEQAKRMLSLAAMSGDDRAMTWIKIAEVAALMGREGKALRVFAAQEALRINPESAAAARLVKARGARKAARSMAVG
ncbi:polysialyltransferase family glycosyltransferase [Streptomyces sp. DH24]|uniref:polysialyltransferase family glycosyltransferase n=1 Tax=Streptomyces sp. DH24 TaxID=3040123 RepID=UPI00244220D4|nr:polysialyltransferase family glycosyltransferase [Streptomyces sp. DH24]MDG9717902.1 polysialyltransferase family glycosyltransferase [Streptomyces sp. DH24]